MTEHEAMRRALELAALWPGGGPNPRVGCVLLAPDGAVLAEGHHRGAGTTHAEVDALQRAVAAHGAGAARGATAVVTLEPCNHHGRTGPCVEALLDAGVTRVVYGQQDPNPSAAGGSARLRAAGVDVVGGMLAAEARSLNPTWTRAVGLGRPVVTWKLAGSLDGRSAAADGTSRWISGRSARTDAHRLRAAVDAVMVGTGTVAVDDPDLTVRHVPLDGPPPERVVVGLRDLPAASRLARAAAQGERVHHVRTHDPHAALEALWYLEHRHVLLEGGPTLAAAFWRAGLVDEVVAYVAPVLLGLGTPAVGDLGIGTVADAARLDLLDVTVLPVAEQGGVQDPTDTTTVRLTLRPRKES
ncbi:bifunctional diaminohydroxyphosphoribosylaminopyrimidine deaminase/5-amino-6-(5-phosphoribosylamino)uracil reductase RibD [Isoptericola sp. NEAU-Y5]|uniref:Riboflavin biosynthesis protein RibD n=1 Tax=Isoptericola luteus TaxID=2879484 RepID=A0ABS7ZEW9_9MICO|nr:bifunctional diaminohydroxyphosphoribosylaminopyrimidine deaminase/5-amino-6-(5-phosphoribosylamino)uracil reductase RibD [Isoptericola sp. NEAU-Y5]MCA5893590.1 bifunctional diaminohydroxyphosphoribosylaminopyrimidine deaminase/5-amino-6-(5-phosphoribosylamino)uracil reductase RibD [Isoptericola sp. NEAU-Y5]